MSDPRMIPADEAQALQGAATKGPWAIDPDGDVIKPHSYDAEFSVYICSPEGGNRELVAAAPDLAHTVVEQAAQIERVGEALKALRDYYIDREARSRERLESATDEREQSHLARFAHSHRRTHEALTRILDGRNDE